MATTIISPCGDRLIWVKCPIHGPSWRATGESCPNCKR